jgi:hypothetical protein
MNLGNHTYECNKNMTRPKRNRKRDPAYYNHWRSHLSDVEKSGENSPGENSVKENVSDKVQITIGDGRI